MPYLKTFLILAKFCIFKWFGYKELINALYCKLFKFGENMSYEILVGLNVLDKSKYEEYRVAMRPILSQYEGRFGYDFHVSEVLITEKNNDINRVFTINFSSKNNMESFFSDQNYLEVREKYFNASVGGAIRIASYEKVD